MGLVGDESMASVINSCASRNLDLPPEGPCSEKMCLHAVAMVAVGVRVVVVVKEGMTPGGAAAVVR